MSLNFVSTTVLSSTDGVSHNEETRLESASSITQSEHYKPLYEQLRQNAQEEQDRYDEQTKAMRGSQALDDEDVAYLQSVEDEKAERLRLQALQEKEELESFRLAKLDHQERNAMSGDREHRKNTDVHALKTNEPSKEEINQTRSEEKISSLMQLKPKIVVTKKRRRKLATKETIAKIVKKCNENNSKENSSTKDKNEIIRANVEGNGDESKDSNDTNSGSLGTLLCGYDSNSDSD